MDINQEQVLGALIGACQCSLALEAPFKDGLATLVGHGFDYSNRFQLSATEFVKQKTKEALDLANKHGVQ